MSKIGYCRVSTVDQDLDTEIEKLTAEGCGIIRREKVNGASQDRDELAGAVEHQHDDNWDLNHGEHPEADPGL